MREERQDNVTRNIVFLYRVSIFSTFAIVETGIKRRWIPRAIMRIINYVQFPTLYRKVLRH